MTLSRNGDRYCHLQSAGFDLAIRLADRVIVHTRCAKDRLIGRGHEPSRIAVAGHGPLQLEIASARSATRQGDDRWTIVCFGRLKPYKGLNTLVEAIGSLPGAQRNGLRVVIAGEPYLDLVPIRKRIKALGISDTIALRLGRLWNPKWPLCSKKPTALSSLIPTSMRAVFIF